MRFDKIYFVGNKGLGNNTAVLHALHCMYAWNGLDIRMEKYASCLSSCSCSCSCVCMC